LIFFNGRDESLSGLQGDLISKGNDLELELIGGGFETGITVQNQVSRDVFFWGGLLFVLVDDLLLLEVLLDTSNIAG
jgi:hypothetical protein